MLLGSGACEAVTPKEIAKVGSFPLERSRGAWLEAFWRSVKRQRLISRTRPPGKVAQDSRLRRPAIPATARRIREASLQLVPPLSRWRLPTHPMAGDVATLAKSPGPTI